MLRAARQRLPAMALAAWSRSPASRDAVRDIAEVHADPLAATRGADCVVLAAPVDALPGLLHAIVPALGPETWVTDVGSTKRGVHAAARSVLPHPCRFVGGHPMAGSERGGATEGRADLFAGRPCVVTADADTAAGLPARAARLWTALGAKVIQLDPAAHDAAVAAISHLPHAVACALAHCLAGRDPRLDLAAGGLRDTTRVAGGDPSLWVPILLENADHLVPLLSGLERSAGELRAALAAGDRGALAAYLEQSRAFRRRLDQP